MSTRSQTIIITKSKWRDWDTKNVTVETKEVGRFYRHCDGYIEGHGADIAFAIAGMSYDDDLNNRNWAQHFYKWMCSADCDIEFEPADATEHGDIEYLYRIIGHADYTGGKEDDDDAAGKVIIEVYRHHYDVDYADTVKDENLEFRGNYLELLAKLANDGNDIMSMAPSSWAVGRVRSLKYAIRTFAK